MRLKYGIPFQKTKQNIQKKIQNKALRFIVNIKVQVIFSELSREVGIESLQKRRMNARLSHFSKCIAESIEPSFQYDREQYLNLRSFLLFARHSIPVTHLVTCLVEDRTLKMAIYIGLNRECLVCVQCFVSWQVRVVAYCQLFLCVQCIQLQDPHTRREEAVIVSPTRCKYVASSNAVCEQIR